MEGLELNPRPDAGSPPTDCRAQPGRRAAAMLLAALVLVGCSSREIYDASQGWRRNECNKIAEQDKRDRCLKEEAGRSYDDYRGGAASQASR